MVSLFSPSTSIHIPRLHFTFNPNFLFHHVNLSLFKLRPPRQSNHFSFNSVKKGPSLRIRNEQQQEQPQPRPRTLFPSGYKQPEIKVPSLVLQLSAEEVMNDKSTLDLVDKALSNGSFGIVVLDGGEGSSGKLLYEAACLLKSVIRERAYLMISERVDIASAVNASGVVLADQGLPTIVARNMMMGSQSESIYFPLVARKVQTSNAALNASNLEGADFLISGVDGEKPPDELGNTIFRSVRIPNFILIDSPGEERLHKDAQMLLKSGTSGLVVSLKDWKSFTDDYFSKLLYAGYASDKNIHEKIESPATLGRDNGFPGKKGVTGFIKLQDREVQLLEKERLILLEAKKVIQRAAPLMEEVSLLSDAVSQLDEPFSLVIVGEFNSGKSTVINALLGKKYLKDGVVPTTNEITFLRYSEFNSSEQKRCERRPDGQYICYLPAPILKEMVIVDTPGTNVILQRQQRLTEEFLPRADLLIFVMSADRPLSESEVSFLRYTQQWKKKVVFVLNKSDLYQNASELEEAIAFIKENAQKLLNTERVILYHLSARSALESKLSAVSDISTDHEVSMKNSYSTGSFDEFEKFLFSFLDGSTSMGIERMTLKLETPVRIAEQLLYSCGKLVSEEYQHAKRDLKFVNELVSSVKEYTFKMETESLSWRRQILSLIDTTQARIMKLIESTLLLSNLDLVTSYAFKGGKSTSMPAALSIKNDIIGPSLSEAQKVLGEFVTWLESNNGREGRLYRESFEKRWPSIDSHNLDQLKIDAILGRRHELSKKVVENFSASAASTLFEQEIREVFLGTFGGLGVAGLSASLLTSVLPTTLEDLLALGLCSAGGLLAISNFPARRQQLVEKVKRTVSAFAHELEEEMQKDVLETVDDLDNFVKLIGKPYQEQAQVRLHKLSETREELTNIEKKLKELQIEIHNLHILLS